MLRLLSFSRYLTPSLRCRGDPGLVVQWRNGSDRGLSPKQGVVHIHSGKVETRKVSEAYTLAGAVPEVGSLA